MGEPAMNIFGHFLHCDAILMMMPRIKIILEICTIWWR